MFDILYARWKQGHRTMAYPAGPAPALPERFAGRPAVHAARCPSGCTACADACPTGAITLGTDSGTAQAGCPAESAGDCQEGAARKDRPSPVRLDMGRCLFCRACEKSCQPGGIRFTREYQLAAASRELLHVTDAAEQAPAALSEKARRLFGRSLKLREVSAGGCNACEADTNVLGTLAWDLGRFGIQFVASPRHADGLLVTGPVPENMRLALEKTYQAVPSPKLVIAVGSCAISGGPYAGNPECRGGASEVIPVDLFVPGCPPHPLTILDALLRFLGR